jgi:hypothetical protein
LLRRPAWCCCRMVLSTTTVSFVDAPSKVAFRSAPAVDVNRSNMRNETQNATVLYYADGSPETAQSDKVRTQYQYQYYGRYHLTAQTSRNFSPSTGVAIQHYSTAVKPSYSTATESSLHSTPHWIWIPWRPVPRHPIRLHSGTATFSVLPSLRVACPNPLVH